MSERDLMYAACFTISGWAGPQDYIFSGDTLMDVMNEFNDVQDIMCLTGMAMQEEDADDPNIQKLAKFAENYSSGKVRGKDIESFEVHLSVGFMKCNELIRGKEAVGKLKTKYPDAIIR